MGWLSTCRAAVLSVNAPGGTYKPIHQRGVAVHFTYLIAATTALLLSKTAGGAHSWVRAQAPDAVKPDQSNHDSMFPFAFWRLQSIK